MVETRYWQEPLGEWFRREVLPRLNIELVYGEDGVKWGRAGRWLTRPCPLHGGDGRNFHVNRDTLTWRCHSICQEGGDVVDYVQRMHGKDFVDAVRHLASLVGMELPNERRGPRAIGQRRKEPPAVKQPRPPERMPATERKRAEREEVNAFWAACLPLSSASSSKAEPDIAATAFLAHRGWTKENIATLERLDLARLTPLPGAYAFPEWWPERWSHVWRLVVPAYEADGTVVSFHARAIREVGERPKTRWPLGVSSSELLLADDLGHALLRGELHGELEAVVLVEGLTGLLNVTLRAMEAKRNVAALAFTSGGPPALAKVKWPTGVEAWVATDKDQAGEHYAAQVNSLLGPRGIKVCRLDFSLAKGAA